jgi:lipoprotein-releasing system permease protein
MAMSAAFPLFVGLRYAALPRGNRFASLVSAVALLAMSLGVAALIVVLSVMNGFEQELRDRILAVTPHAVISGPAEAQAAWSELEARLDATGALRARAPFSGAAVMLSAGSRVQGVQLEGIEPQREAAASGLDAFFIDGGLAALRPGEYRIALGSLVARELGVVPGDRVTVVLPELVLSPAGVLPRLRQFEVAGVFRVGAQVDASTAFVHRLDAARLLRRDASRELRLWFHDPRQAPAAMARLEGALDEGFVATDWSASQGSLFAAIRMEKRVIGLLLLVMVAVAAFNIVSIMTMTVAEKRGAIAVLRTLGASRSQIMGIFLTRGMLLGGSGLLLGLAMGLPLARYAGAVTAWIEGLFGFRLFNPGVYFISYLPSLLRWQDVVQISLVAVLLTVLATLYPAWRATRVGPAELLAHD